MRRLWHSRRVTAMPHESQPADTFDYIVVGAGSAGCVLANRLTVGGRHRVLLLEAGGSDRGFWLRVPIGYGKTYYDPRFNWKFMSEPVPGLGGRPSYWPRGKLLGGSTRSTPWSTSAASTPTSTTGRRFRQPRVGVGGRRPGVSGGMETHPPPGPTSGAGPAGRSTSRTCARRCIRSARPGSPPAEAAGLARNRRTSTAPGRRGSGISSDHHPAPGPGLGGHRLPAASDCAGGT